jgi:hypothetical protein
MATEYVEIVVEGLPVPVTKKQAEAHNAGDPKIAEMVRENRHKFRLGSGEDEFVDKKMMSGKPGSEG